MDARLTVLDLLSDVVGFSLGLEWTGGLETVGFCEVCPKARRVFVLGWRSQGFQSPVLASRLSEVIHGRPGRLWGSGRRGGVPGVR